MKKKLEELLTNQQKSQVLDSEIEQISFHKQIDGFLSDNEALELFRLSKSIKSLRPVIVELGSWLGKSSFLLAKGVEEKQDAIVYCIDPFNMSSISETSLAKRKEIVRRPLKEQFIENMKNGGVIEKIQILQGYSFEFSKSFDKEIDLLFIDANHDYESVLNDFLEWSILVKQGGLLIMDDVYIGENIIHEGPKRVVEEKIINDTKWSSIKLVDALFVAERV